MDVLHTTLSWDPTSRSKAIILLNRPYFAAWRSGEDEAVCPTVSADLISQLQSYANFSYLHAHLLTSAEIPGSFVDNSI